MSDDGDHAYPGIPDGLTPAAKLRSQVFMKAYRQELDKAKAVALAILVWGPSPKATGSVAAKRKQIWTALRQNGHLALFSEELTDATSDVPLKASEFAQAKAADLIIVLVEDSIGALAEAHDFCNHPELAPKMLVMFPKKHEGGYSEQGALSLLSWGYGGVHKYEDDEIEKCTVLSKAVKCAEARRIIRFMNGGQE